jgi:histidinol dehydrogenase
LDFDAHDEQRRSVREICRRVRVEGDAALREYSARYDGWSGDDFRVPDGELEAARRRLPPKSARALEFAAARIRRFHEQQTYPHEVGSGGLRLLTRPVRRAGLYVPGGRAAYPSTVLMTAIPARVAGVRDVVLATPPGPGGSVPDAILAAAAIAEVDAVYRIGGAQAIAALAYGTESVPRADVVAGPGNLYVTLAKHEVFGAAGVDGIAGPTEILIVAGADAPPDFLAADLASQLEHDPLAWAVLVTDSEGLARAVEHELESLLATLERADVIAAAHCCIVITSDLDEAVAIANEFAPEHLELVVDDVSLRLGQVENAGAVFVGSYAAVSLGDYVVGTNHTLPTAGSARFASPLGVDAFLKRTSVAELNRDDLLQLREAAVAMARLEGLTAHAHAVEVRAGG